MKLLYFKALNYTVSLQNNTEVIAASNSHSSLLMPWKENELHSFKPQAATPNPHCFTAGLKNKISQIFDIDFFFLSGFAQV